VTAQQRLYWITARDGETGFPGVERALPEPDGLLAVGGRLSPARLQSAYRRGIFPWFSIGQPVLWWSPNPRCVLFPERLKVSRSLRKTLRKGRFEAGFDRAFGEVLSRCAAPRGGQEGTWITPGMARAYLRLHQLGIAHSLEVRSEGRLVGGLYGLALGRVFFGESMFSLVADASKTALVYLVAQLQQWGYPLIDCQVSSAHLHGLGAENIPRRDFVELLDTHCERDGRSEAWPARLPVELLGPWVGRPRD
jgi:leucyl/phenylalanyl-tRNA--protein transferase